MIKTIIDRFGFEFFNSSLTCDQKIEYSSTGKVAKPAHHLEYVMSLNSIEELLLELVQVGFDTSINVSSPTFHKNLNDLIKLLPHKERSNGSKHIDFESTAVSGCVEKFMSNGRFERLKCGDSYTTNFSNESIGEIKKLVYDILDDNSIVVLSELSKTIDPYSNISKQKDGIMKIVYDFQEDPIIDVLVDSLVEIKMQNSVGTYDILKKHGFDTLKSIHTNSSLLYSDSERGGTTKITMLCNNVFVEELIEW
jgi:hypothetical protein